MSERKNRGVFVPADINVFDGIYSEFINYIDKAWKKVYLCADEKKSDTHNRNHPRGSDHEALAGVRNKRAVKRQAIKSAFKALPGIIGSSATSLGKGLTGFVARMASKGEKQ